MIPFMLRVLPIILVITCTSGCRNLHQIEGNWWRSAQPKGWLDDFVEEKQVDAILNLRGHNHGHKDYEREIKIAKSHDVKFVGIPISSKSQPSTESLEKILEFIDEHRDDNVLIHCAGGADRTSLVAFLYLVEVHGWDKERARKKSVSWKYGHFKSKWIPWSKPEIDRFVDEWENRP